jgi:hypothetical protein
MNSSSTTHWRSTALEQPWYVVTHNGHDLANLVLGRIRKPGKIIYSLSWRGAQIMADPADSIHYGYGLRFTPWQVWRVRPAASIRVDPNPFTNYEPTRTPEHLWTRSYIVAEQMPAGFEYGPNGGPTRRIIEHLAGIDPFREVDEAMAQPQYRAAYKALETAVAAAPEIPIVRRALATSYFEKIAGQNVAIGRKSPERWTRIHGPFQWHTSSIISASLHGITIPAVIQDFWGIPRLDGGYGFEWDNNAAGR